MISNYQGHSEVLERVLREADAHPGLDAPAERELIRRQADGDDEALGELVTANLSRVVHVARSYRNLGLPLEDLVHEGAVGLLEAASKFDQARGVRFFTYACFFVRRAIVLALSRSAKTIRLPRQLSARLRRLRRLQAAEPGTDSISAEDAARSLGISVAEAHALCEFHAPYEVSVDEPLSPGGGSRAETLASKEVAPDERFFDAEWRRELSRALDALPDREGEILKERYGLQGEPARTLREVGSVLSLSKERVRQLEERAQCRLRAELTARWSAVEAPAAATLSGARRTCRPWSVLA